MVQHREGSTWTTKQIEQRGCVGVDERAEAFNATTMMTVQFNCGVWVSVQLRENGIRRMVMRHVLDMRWYSCVK